MPTLHIDDAIEHLVGYLRDEITKPPLRMPVSTGDSITRNTGRPPSRPPPRPYAASSDTIN